MFYAIIEDARHLDSQDMDKIDDSRSLIHTKYAPFMLIITQHPIRKYVSCSSRHQTRHRKTKIPSPQPSHLLSPTRNLETCDVHPSTGLSTSLSRHQMTPMDHRGISIRAVCSAVVTWMFSVHDHAATLMYTKA